MWIGHRTSILDWIQSTHLFQLNSSWKGVSNRVCVKVLAYLAVMKNKKGDTVTMRQRARLVAEEFIVKYWLTQHWWQIKFMSSWRPIKCCRNVINQISVILACLVNFNPLVKWALSENTRNLKQLEHLFRTVYCVCPWYVCGRHRSSVVRNATSRLVVSIAESLGPGRVLSGIRDITDRMLCTAANLMLDSSADTR